MHHVAQFNIAKARYPLDDPRMADCGRVQFCDDVSVARDAALRERRRRVA